MFRKSLLLSVVAGIFFVSCSTMGDYDFTTVNQSLNTGEYEAAYQVITEDSERIYSSHDEVLQSLDLGILSHYAGEYQRSNKELTQAEKKIEEYYAKSITQSISSYLVNDTIVDYDGEVFEDIYINIFMALNYIHLGNIEDAFVEIRRFDNKLKAASAKYSDKIAAANQENSSKGEKSIDVPKMHFHNSALARYLSMILYRSRGQLDSAQIDMNYLDSAFASQPSLYNFSKPRSLEQELNVPKGQGRVNVIAFTGKSPVKIEEDLKLYSYGGDFYYKIAYPEMRQQISAIHSVQVSAIPAGEIIAGQRSQLPNEVKRVSLEPLESISNIAMDTFEQHKALIYLRAVIRSIGKATTSSVWGVMADRSSDVGIGLLFSALEFASVVSTDISERADVRVARYLPSLAWVTGINLDPGDYILNIEYKNESGALIAMEQKNITVSASTVNLVEGICLK